MRLFQEACLIPRDFPKSLHIGFYKSRAPIPREVIWGWQNRGVRTRGGSWCPGSSLAAACIPLSAMDTWTRRVCCRQGQMGPGLAFRFAECRSVLARLFLMEDKYESLQFFLHWSFLFLFFLNHNKSFSALGPVISFALIFLSNSPLKHVCARRFLGTYRRMASGLN